MTAIGVFDSGIGGLSVLQQLQQSYPTLSFVYVADTQNFAWGLLSVTKLQRIALQICRFLLQQGCQILVIACHTASAVCYPFLRAHLPQGVTLISIIEPVLKSIEQSSLCSIGLIATPNTLQTGLYQQRLKKYHLITIATPTLADLVEKDLKCIRTIRQTLEYYLQTTPKLDGLILGCTHYSFLSPYLKLYYRLQGPQLLDAATLLPSFLDLRSKNIAAVSTRIFYSSASNPTFSQVVQRLFGLRAISIHQIFEKQQDNCVEK